MGTNYYYQPPLKNCCPTCGRGDAEEEIHIGKSSAGWVFSLHVTDEIPNLEAWKAKWAEGGTIRDEYGEVISTEEMLRCITERKWPGSEEPPHGYATYEAFLQCNHAIRGPNGLLRHRPNPRYRSDDVVHGEGTWDMFRGNFS